MKKIVILLIIVLPAMLVTGRAYAQVFFVGDFKYNITSSIEPRTVEVLANYYTGEITIPQSVEYDDDTYTVTAIGLSAFANRTHFLTSVVIPETVKTIGPQAFLNCTGLESIEIPNSVETIGEYAFNGSTGLKSIEIGNSVETIGEFAFAGCTGLENFAVIEDNPRYSSFDGVLFNRDKTVLVSYPGGRSGDYKIPGSVIEIGTYAFAFCPGLESVEIGNSVIGIGTYAFDHCENLTSVKIGNSVKTIGNQAFSNCTNLKSVVIGNSVETIGDGAFAGCVYLESVVIPDSVEMIGTGAFSYCFSLESVEIGNSVETIRDGAFASCTNLESVEIGNSVEEIGDYAFFYCSSLTEIIVKAETPPTIFASTFDGGFSGAINVPCGTADDYKNAQYWDSYVAQIAGDVPPDITLESD
ncbi:MAG: leucine-rich repeat domain-containing protein, partial [Dysgonamonadaceae bacterium]|nr:leucine-rich repeat domain-containing protein [Dysgonamonadaceae bacterium]